MNYRKKEVTWKWGGEESCHPSPWQSALDLGIWWTELPAATVAQATAARATGCAPILSLSWGSIWVSQDHSLASWVQLGGSRGRNGGLDPGSHVQLGDPHLPSGPCLCLAGPSLFLWAYFSESLMFPWFHSSPLTHFVAGQSSKSSGGSAGPWSEGQRKGSLPELRARSNLDKRVRMSIKHSGLWSTHSPVFLLV